MAEGGKEALRAAGELVARPGVAALPNKRTSQWPA